MLTISLSEFWCHYVKVVVLKWSKIVPSLIACLMCFENMIFYVGSETAGSAWTEYSHLF